MNNSPPLAYLRTMFATCMLFQVIYVICVALWFLFPDLKGHVVVTTIFPEFQFLTFLSFVYGLVASMIYGWSVAIIFVFFYNAWPWFAGVVFGKNDTMDAPVRTR
jgi:hypothetical protein